MGVKYRTVNNIFPDVTRSIQMLNGKKVDVGCMKGDNAWLASIHEYGCNIKPKNAQYLTVPVSSKTKGKKAGEFSDLFVLTSKKGNKFLAQKQGENVELMFWLAKSVKIPERSFLRTGHDTHIDEVLKKADRMIGQVANGKMSSEQVLKTVGITLSTKIKTYARDLSSPPNHSFTIEQKGSSNPLVDTENMIEDISYEVK